MHWTPTTRTVRMNRAVKFDYLLVPSSLLLPWSGCGDSGARSTVRVVWSACIGDLSVPSSLLLPWSGCGHSGARSTVRVVWSACIGDLSVLSVHVKSKIDTKHMNQSVLEISVLPISSDNSDWLYQTWICHWYLMYSCLLLFSLLSARHYPLNCKDLQCYETDLHQFFYQCLQLIKTSWQKHMRKHLATYFLLCDNCVLRCLSSSAKSRGCNHRDTNRRPCILCRRSSRLEQFVVIDAECTFVACF